MAPDIQAQCHHIHKKLTQKGGPGGKAKLADHDNGRVTGKRKALKLSEHYPKKLCKAVAAMHHKYVLTL